MEKTQKNEPKQASSWLSFCLIFVAVLAFICLCPIAVRATRINKIHQGPAIGIDLGTTYSCIGVYRNDSIEIIPGADGRTCIPSWVSFDGPTINVGAVAKNNAKTNPSNTIFDIKRLIGRDMSEPGIQEDIKRLPYKVVNRDGKPKVSVLYNGSQREFSPEEISSMILSTLKKTAEAYLGEHVSNVVITVPAYFNNAQREATKAAAELAYLHVDRLTNEPTAAAIAYGLNKSDRDHKTLVFDLGGGTLDVSLLSIEDNVFEVLAVSGDTHLGGEDFDNRLMDRIVRQYPHLQRDNKALGVLKQDIESAKKTLSERASTTISVGNETVSLSHQEFEDLNSDLFLRALKPVESVLKDANVAKKEIDEVILVGGSTRIPKIQELLSDYFDGKPLYKDIDPDEAVVRGAALQASWLGNDDSLCGLTLDVTPLTLGIETEGGVLTPLIARNTVTPTFKKQIFSTVVDDQEMVSIRVFEGERPFTKDNNLLGQFNLTGISPAPKGVPQIEVRFEVNADGILTVRATEKGINKEEKVLVINENRSSYEESKRMIEEAEKHKHMDDQTSRYVIFASQFSKHLTEARSAFVDKNGWFAKIKQVDKDSLRLDVMALEDWFNFEYDHDTPLQVLEEKLSALQSKLENGVHGVKYYDRDALDL